MKPIKFSKEETRAIVGEIQDYFARELDQTIGNIPAEMLLMFFCERIGAYFYNRGIYDAQGLLKDQIDDLSDAIFALEQPTNHLR